MKINSLLAVSIISALEGLLVLPKLADAAGTLSIGRLQGSTNFDPIKTLQNSDLWVLSNVYDVLVRVDKSGTKFEPGLAERWNLSDDGTVYTFKMREAKFENGSRITARDAAFSLRRIRDNKGSLWAQPFTVMKSVEAKDDTTLVVTLQQRVAPFLAWLASPSASILSEKAVSSIGEDKYSERPVASGAFGVADWRINDFVRLKKNPNFWQADQVKLDEVRWIPVDDSTRTSSLEKGEIDCAISLPFAAVKPLELNRDLKVYIEPSTREDFLVINNARGQLRKKEVREALNYAIDKQEIVRLVTEDNGTVANSYIPEGDPNYNNSILVRHHDIAKAEQLLKDAGVKDAAPAGLELKYIVDKGDVTRWDLFTTLKQQLARVDIKLTPESVDPGALFNVLAAGDFDIAVLYWTNDIIDPDQKTTYLLGDEPYAYTRYENDKAKALVADARKADTKIRNKMYMEIQSIANRDIPWIDLYYTRFINACQKKVIGFHQSPLGRFSLEDTDKPQGD